MFGRNIEDLQIMNRIRNFFLSIPALCVLSLVVVARPQPVFVLDDVEKISDLIVMLRVLDIQQSGTSKRLPLGGILGTDGAAPDTHFVHWTDVVTNPTNNSYTVDQDYQFKDTMLGTNWTNIPGPGN